ncbi:unnamed protein product, partial [Rotaria sp. Silwood1]
MAGDGHVILS